jgi:hypothetical protein
VQENPVLYPAGIDQAQAGDFILDQESFSVCKGGGILPANNQIPDKRIDLVDKARPYQAGDQFPPPSTMSRWIPIAPSSSMRISRSTSSVPARITVA